jgi:hypothetical protein
MRKKGALSAAGCSAEEDDLPLFYRQADIRKYRRKIPGIGEAYMG